MPLMDANTYMHTENSGHRERIAVEPSDDGGHIHLAVTGLFGRAGIWLTPADARRLAEMLTTAAN